MWDNATLRWEFGGNILSGIPDLRLGGAGVGSMTISGGSAINKGGGARYYGDAHATQANDTEFMAAGGIWLDWDYSLTTATCRGSIVAGMDRDLYVRGSTNAYRGVKANTTNLNLTLNSGSGGEPRQYFYGSTNGQADAGGSFWSAASSGSSIKLFSGLHSTQASDVEFKSGSSVWLKWDSGAITSTFTNKVNVDNILRVGALGSAATRNTLTLLSDAPRMLLGTGATQPNWKIAAQDSVDRGLTIAVGLTNDTDPTDDTFTDLFTIKENGDGTVVGNFTVGGNLVLSDPDMYRSVNTDTLVIGGGTSGSGANIKLNGGAHPLDANDMSLRAGSTVWLRWDDSIQAAAVTGALTASGVVTLNGVSGASSATLTLGGNSGVSTSFHYGSNNDNYISRGAGGITRFRDTLGAVDLTLNSIGAEFTSNVAIGKAPSSNWSPAYGGSAQVGQAMAIAGAKNANNGFLSNNALYDNINWLYTNDGSAAQFFLNTDGSLKYRQAGVGLAGATITWADAFVVNSSGYVGIGAAPSTGTALYIEEATNPAIRMTYGTAGTASHKINWSSQDLQLRAGTGGNANDALSKMLFYTANNTLALTLDASQNAIFGGDMYAPTLSRGNATASLGLSGGGDGTQGANLLLYGQSHATQAYDIVFRTNTAIKLQFDSSLKLWDFKDNRVAATARGGTALAAYGAKGGDTEYCFQSFNTSASGASQFFIRHNLGAVALGNARGDLNLQAEGGSVTLGGKLNYGASGALVIATGAITITKSFHKIDTEASAATDDLAIINGGVDGDVLILKAVDNARTVVVKDGSGNILLAGDMSLDSNADTLSLIYDNGSWLETSRSNNAA
jgi:hypothetical protein